MPLCPAHHGAERIHNDDMRIGSLNLFDNFFQDRAKVIIQNELTQIDETD